MNSASTASTNQIMGLRPEVKQARTSLAEERDKLELQHRNGSPGIQVCAHFTDILDEVVITLFESALRDLFPDDPAIHSKVVLVPHGGYGRREMAPYSDVDLMLLHAQGTLSTIAPLASRLVQDLSDIGLELGFSLRTTGQACSMSLRDPIILTSLTESRYLAGGMRLFSYFTRKFQKMVKKKSKSLVIMAEEARKAERAKYGEAVHLLVPNVKRSRGGLRDIQLLRWIGFLRYGQNEPDLLHHSDLLEARDYRRIREAQDFLLRLRNELHFHAGSSNDTLDKGEQKRIAELRGYEGAEGVFPVEQFMQQYFQHSQAIRECVGHFVSGARWRPWYGTATLGAIFSTTIDGDYRITPRFISVTKAGLEKVTTNLSDVLHLMQLSNQFNRRIDHPTWQAIREAMTLKNFESVDEATANRFRSLIAEPNPRLGKIIRRLHELRVLEKLVPGYMHARCLLQFNEYHKYTVDEHSIRAVEFAISLTDEDSRLGREYQAIEDKSLFHLALLTHDLGKGYDEDHSDVGARNALKVAKRLFLSAEDRERLRFLVHKHLMLSHLAFRRDLNDEQLVQRHADEIGSSRLLRMLYVLTCADLAAVGPGVLNSWKIDVLSGLYERMRGYIKEDANISDSQVRITAIRANLADKVDDDPWLERQVQRLPPAYLEGPTVHLLVDDLRRLQSLKRNDIASWGRYLNDRDAVEFSVAAYEARTPGVFHRLAGAFSSKGLQIISAEIHNLADGLILDRFFVHDDEHEREPPEWRFDEINKLLKQAIMDEDYVPTLRTKWQDASDGEAKAMTELPTRVRLNNDISDTATVIEVFAHDQSGLLHRIAKTIFDLELSVHNAKIGTYIDQVVDVFYVTDFNNKKLKDPEQLEKIRQSLLEEIAEFTRA